MKTAEQKTTTGPMWEPPGLTCCLMLKAIYAMEAAQYRMQAYGRERWQMLVRVVRAAWPAGRPAL
jgi:hypothetical protein